MYNNFDYPIGSDTPSAPWNQEPEQEQEVEVDITQTLHKNTTVKSRFDEPDAAYNEHHYTPSELLGLFSKYLKENMSKGVVYKTPSVTNHIIEDCENWEVSNIQNAN